MTAIVVECWQPKGALIADDTTGECLTPFMEGEERELMLRAFIEWVPVDLGKLNEETRQVLFVEFLQRMAADAESAETPPVEAPKEQPAAKLTGDAAVELASAHLTAAEGASTDEPPAEQAADTDDDAAPEPATQIITCPACDGGGMIAMSDGEPAVRCNMCQGTGKLKAQVPA